MRDTPAVLVVDDTEANIDILVDLLGDDYEVMVAMDGQSALEAVAEDLPDLILLDIMMPGMDGYEVCSRLKADPHTQEVPIIFVTAMDQEADEAHGLDLGAIDYITKPFRPAIVKARVRNHLALVEAARLKEDVERIMRHDLKTPLTSIISLPQLLLMADNLEEHQREWAERIEDAGYTVLSMVNLSSALFKMERGTYSFSPEEVDLLPVLRKILANEEDLLSAHEVAVGLELDGSQPGPEDAFPVQGEELLCYSMFCNLITNAIEASPEGGTVAIRLASGDPAKVAVHNPGAVPEAVRGRFFAKYATAGKARGTGLGTYSARLIARTHGGDIHMETGEESGTTVTVTLPS